MFNLSKVMPVNEGNKCNAMRYPSKGLNPATVRRNPCWALNRQGIEKGEAKKMTNSESSRHARIDGPE